MEGRLREHYLPALLYLMGLNVLVLTSVALLHELGHVVVGWLSGCRGMDIVLFAGGTGATYTEMSCASAPGSAAFFLSSFLLIAPLSALFYMLKGFKERFMAYIVLGAGIAMSGADLGVLVGASYPAVIPLAVGGTLFVYGEYMLMRGIIETEIIRTAGTATTTN
jgi:hypothetical protein